MITIGVDEAGRGSIIGPLTIGGVALEDKDAKTLKDLGVKDSKLLSIKKINELEPKIKEIANGYKVVALSPEEIDNRFDDEKNLNYMELDNMINIARSLAGERLIIDSPSANTSKIKKYVEIQIRDKEIIAANYADRDYIEVGAASILAKAEREREVSRIVKEIGYDFGSGYPSDPRTKEFLVKLRNEGLLEDEKLRKYIRKTWRTFKNIKNLTLDDF